MKKNKFIENPILIKLSKKSIKCKRFKYFYSNYIYQFKLLSTLKYYFKNKNVLDIGCNRGFWDFIISQYANTVIGIDINKKFIESAEYVKNKLNINNINFLNKDSLEIDENYIKENNINALFLFNTYKYFRNNKTDHILKDNLSNINTIITNEPLYNNMYKIILFNFKQEKVPYENNTLWVKSKKNKLIFNKEIIK